MRFLLLFGIFLAAIAGASAEELSLHHNARVIGKGLFQDCPECPEMVVIPAGKFIMGSPGSEEERFDSEGPQHLVSLHWFALSRHDVTVEEFSVFVHETGYETADCNWPQSSNWHSPGFLPKGPVVCVNWQDAKAYVAWLNGKLAGQSSASSGPYRLPSEAEWEYAARAGTKTMRWWGDAIGSNNANCNGCGSAWDNKRLSPVESFAPNPFGLYDMLGNVWQWTEDCWNENYVGAPQDGSAWTSGDCGKRVLRGGSWSSLPKIIRSASRNGEGLTRRNDDYSSYTGFRVAMTLP